MFLRDVQQDFAGFQLGLVIGKFCPVRIQGIFLSLRIDLGDHIALFDFLSQNDIEFFDLSRYLSTDIDEVDRCDFACRFNNLADVAHTGFFRHVSNIVLAGRKPVR